MSKDEVRAASERAGDPPLDGIEEGVPPGAEESATPPADAAVHRDQERAPQSIRDQITARFSRQRAADNEAHADPENIPPFARASQEVLDDTSGADDNDDGSSEPEVRQAEPARTSRPAAEAQTFELTVRGNKIRMTRDQMIAAAQIDPSEADGLPDSTLVRAAQMMEASKGYLSEARETARNARNSRPSAAPDMEPETTGEDGQGDTGSEPPVDPFVDAAEKIQFGSPEEAADSLRKAMLAGNAALSREERSRQIEQETQAAIDAFAQENSDLDEDLAAMTFNRAMREIQEDLVRIGAGSREEVEARVSNPEIAAHVYREARNRGLAVRSQKQILDAAALHVRQRFAPETIRTPQQQTKQPPQNGMDQRLAAKRTLPSHPTTAAPSGKAQQPNAADPQMSERSRAVQEMRKARGFSR